MLFSFRATVSIPLRVSPFQALFGRQLTVGRDLALLKKFESVSDVQSYAADFASKLHLTQDVIGQNMKGKGILRYGY